MFSNIKRVRESYELTQREMAKILKISKSSYNNFETGEHIIPLKHLNNFCNIFHVSMDYVCGLVDCNIHVEKKYKLKSKEIGIKLKQIRLKNKLTQMELAKILNTTQSNISSYENGKTLILTAFIYSFAKHFKVSLDYLTGRSNIINTIKINS
jgi:transcriptional regulator with XRE-family HTH domain